MTMTAILNIIQSVMLLALLVVITVETKRMLDVNKVLNMLGEIADNYSDELGKVQRIAKHLREIEDEVLNKKLHSENLNHANEEE